MKTYKDNEVKTWNWLKRQSYIPSSNAIGDGSVAGWQLIEQFPIEKIKHDPDKYPNSISMPQVLEMLNEFYPFGFYPIRINEAGQLLDGQHRLKFARLCGLKFIDVWVEKNI